MLRWRQVAALLDGRTPGGRPEDYPEPNGEMGEGERDLFWWIRDNLPGNEGRAWIGRQDRVTRARRGG